MLLSATSLMLRAMLAVSPAAAAQPVEETVLAAVVYTGNRGEDEDDFFGGDDPQYPCDPEAVDVDACRVEALVRQAGRHGSKLVVVSEAAFEDAVPESLPRVGRRPRRGDALQRRFSDLAAELDLYLVIHLEFSDGEQLRSGQVALNPNGVVVARHYKFELYDSEADEYAPGEDMSVFRTPFGKVGLLICSDLYGDPARHERLVNTLGAQIIALSSVWTVEDSTRWQAAFAHDWRVILVAANGAAGYGRGAGIYDATGKAIVITHDGRDEVVTGAIR